MLLISIGASSLSRPDAHANAIEAAAEAGVRHIAYTSFVAISQGDMSGVSEDHAATERLLRDSGVAWTMLRNSIYMDALVQQAANMLSAGRAIVPPGATRIGYVTRADCAAAAAAVLATRGHENRVYDITGPELVGTRELAAAATAVTGTPVEVVSGSVGEAGGFGGRSLEVVSPHVAELTGRPATGIRELLEANRAQLLAALVN